MSVQVRIIPTSYPANVLTLETILIHIPYLAPMNIVAHLSDFTMFCAGATNVY